MKRDEEREKREKRNDHSVKVTQCKREPCRAISKPPREAEELLRAGMMRAGDDACRGAPNTASSNDERPGMFTPSGWPRACRSPVT